MSADKHGKSTKAGRQRKSGQNLKYFNESRHTKSHIRRIKKHLVRFIGDKAAAAALITHTAKLGSRFA